MPFFDVEQYVGDALESVAGQTFADLELVLVDDGSRDGSRAVVESYLERDPRLRLVTTPNRGLGAARNLGVQHCRGELLAFADSVDIVPPEAYAALGSTLDRTGSDFVVGAAQRLLSTTPTP